MNERLEREDWGLEKEDLIYFEMVKKILYIFLGKFVEDITTLNKTHSLVLVIEVPDLFAY